MSALQSIIGLLFFMAVPFAISGARKNVSTRFVVIGMVSQFALALVLLKLPLISDALLQINRVVALLQNSTNKAAQFMFGYVAGGPPPFDVTASENSFIVAFQVLPLILVISALSALLFHFGILTWVVNLFGKALQKSFKISGPLGFGAASTVFLGTIEAPLIVRPYLARLSKAELLSLITCSMATIAGTVMVLYASVLERVLPNALTHLLTASIISVPAALLLSHLFLPTEISKDDRFVMEKTDKTWIEVFLDAIQDGVKIVISIVAIIVVLFTFIHLIDAVIGGLNSTWSVGKFFNVTLRPIMWLVGFDWEKSGVAAELMGTKIVLNEFVSYLRLSQMSDFSPHEIVVVVYSLCGFANFASCGIIIAGLSAIVPERRREIVQMTLISLLLGNLATLMTGAVVNLVG